MNKRSSSNFFVTQISSTVSYTPLRSSRRSIKHLVVLNEVCVPVQKWPWVGLAWAGLNWVG